jgi:hypothetical protein
MVKKQMISDFKEILKIFNANQVKYMVIGGYAVSEYAGAPLYKRPGHLDRCLEGEFRASVLFP